MVSTNNNRDGVLGCILTGICAHTLAARHSAISDIRMVLLLVACCVRAIRQPSPPPPTAKEGCNSKPNLRLSALFYIVVRLCVSSDVNSTGE